MSITKQEFVAILNAYGSARASADPNLINYSLTMVQQALEQIEFAEPVVEPEVVETDEEASEESSDD